MIRTGIHLFAPLALIAAALLAAPAHAQFSLYSNASASTSIPALNPTTATASGVPAPIGAFFSEVSSLSSTEANALGGVSGQSYGSIGAYRFADDFTVPANRTWEVQSASFYAYQTGAGASVSPFGAVNLRIWSGRPGDPGSTIVFGDTSTNRLTASTSTNTYRVYNTTVGPATTPDSTRPIWKLDASVGITLQPGVYWLDWQITSTDPFGEAFSPTATVAGVRTQASWNAIQFRPAAPPVVAGVWSTILDPGKPSSAADVSQALPFILRGLVNGCGGDFNHDGVVAVADIFAFLSAWFAHDSSADFDHLNGINVADIFAFLGAWFAPCP